MREVEAVVIELKAIAVSISTVAFPSSKVSTIDVIETDIQEIELVSSIGEFHDKDWVISGQDIKEQLSEENVADFLTKELSPSNPISGKEWQKDPGQRKSDWPIQQGRNDKTTDKIEQEISKYYDKTSSSSFLMEMNRCIKEINLLDAQLWRNSGTL